MAGVSDYRRWRNVTGEGGRIFDDSRLNFREFGLRTDGYVLLGDG
ncbi:MAG: hypothetical protein RLZZ490_208 [Cyanobacteriota bacterium]